jgi:hypothetical protein
MPLDNHAWMLMPPTAMLSVLTFTAYFAYRIYCLVIAQQTIQPANALGLAWFFLAIEFLIFGVYSYDLQTIIELRLTLHELQLPRNFLYCSEASHSASRSDHSSASHGNDLKMFLQWILSSRAAERTLTSCSTL